MRIIILLSFLLISSIKTNAQSMFELNQQASEQYDEADRELNITYQALKKAYNDHPYFLKKLLTAQRLWIQYRDALVEMRFPSENPEMDYGSMYRLCEMTYLTELTNKRAQELRDYFNIDCGGPVE